MDWTALEIHHSASGCYRSFKLFSANVGIQLTWRSPRWCERALPSIASRVVASTDSALVQNLLRVNLAIATNLHEKLHKIIINNYKSMLLFLHFEHLPHNSLQTIAVLTLTELLKTSKDTEAIWRWALGTLTGGDENCFATYRAGALVAVAEETRGSVAHLTASQLSSRGGAGWSAAQLALLGCRSA